MGKSIGTLYTESRLLAKTLNRITVEPNRVEMTNWRSEAKLLASPGGSCLSSSTLLVKGRHVPTYGIDGRCYGLLFNAEECNIYDVSTTDSNSNRTSKLALREKRKDIDMFTSNTIGVKTLDELAAEVNASNDGCINEILLDAWKKSCAGLFIRQIDIEKATPMALKHYYQSLLEIALIQKYLIQVFDYPSDFKICQLNERKGKLLTFPALNDVITYARLQGINDKSHPELLRLLDDKYSFAPLLPSLTVKEYLDAYTNADISPFRDEIIAKLVDSFEPFDTRTVNKISILSEPVDLIVGVSESSIIEIIENCQEMHRITTSTKALSISGMFSKKAGNTYNDVPSTKNLSQDTPKSPCANRRIKD